MSLNIVLIKAFVMIKFPNITTGTFYSLLKLASNVDKSQSTAPLHKSKYRYKEWVDLKKKCKKNITTSATGRLCQISCPPVTVQRVLRPFAEKLSDYSNKVSVIGAGMVGMTCVFSMFTQNITNNVAVVDVSAEKLHGEMLDVMHGAVFLNNPKLAASTDYCITAGSKICIVTAGARGGGKSRLKLVQQNSDILKKIIPQLIKYSPDTIILIANNPVDVLTYATWKISGLPLNRVIGAGTTLDTARFRYLLADKIGVAPSSVDAYNIGEHGDSSVPVWSTVNIAGMRLSEVHSQIGTSCDCEKWHDIHVRVVRSAAEVIKTKGYTSWAIALSLANICRAILTNAHTIHPVTTCVKGEHGIQNEAFLSLPCVLGSNGICDVVRLNLTQTELCAFHKSAEIVTKVQADIKF